MVRTILIGLALGILMFLVILVVLITVTISSEGQPEIEKQLAIIHYPLITVGLT